MCPRITPCALVLSTDGFLDIESALQKIDEAASNQEGIAVEEALILRGCVVIPFTLNTPTKFKTFFSSSPQPDQLDAYTDALERLNASIAFGSAEENQRDTVGLPVPSASILSRPPFFPSRLD